MDVNGTKVQRGCYLLAGGASAKLVTEIADSEFIAASWY